MALSNNQINALNDFYKENKVAGELDREKYRVLREKIYIQDFPFHEGAPTLEDLEKELLKQKKIL